MFILPYILQPPQKSSTDFTLRVAWIFTIHGGGGIWETEEELLSEEKVIQEYLEPNGFYGVSKGIIENCLVYEVDPSRTKLSDFYMWSDFIGKGQPPSEGCDIWRPFFWLGDSQLGEDDAWGWESQTTEVSLGKFGSVSKVWELLKCDRNT
jgi:hypothetical protein